MTEQKAPNEEPAIADTDNAIKNRSNWLATDAETPERVGEVPTRVVNTYSRLWQFETWLRTMVYVEARAKLGDDWTRDLKMKPGHLMADKSLTHMPTAEENALSFTQLSDLLAMIDSHWECFECYFPPHGLWTAKLSEVRQIRNRVAHFRIGHTDDYPRLMQFLRDIDQGFWRFCTSYNDTHFFLPPKGNPVAKRFLPLDPLPWVEIERRKWARVGFRNQDLTVGVTIEFQRRPWARMLDWKRGGAGMLYDVRVFAQDRRSFDLGELLNRTRSLHPHLVHLLLGSFSDDFRLTIPAVLGTRKVSGIIDAFHQEALNNVRRRPSLDTEQVQALADQWPEYVLGPNNPLAFLGPDMPCSFFGV